MSRGRSDDGLVLIVAGELFREKRILDDILHVFEPRLVARSDTFNKSKRHSLKVKFSEQTLVVMEKIENEPSGIVTIVIAAVLISSPLSPSGIKLILASEIKGRVTGDARDAILPKVQEQVSILNSTFSWKESDRAAAKRATHALTDLAKNGKSSVPLPRSPTVLLPLFQFLKNSVVHVSRCESSNGIRVLNAKNTMQKAKEKNLKGYREKQQFSTESSITSMCVVETAGGVASPGASGSL
ncbi:hypothetical protein Ahy_A09g041447 isoform B [Arachis hypogaea]|uniref:Uncharacterized protein n=1 Tax=Arachis hypogaea TaxID=3818 RepID=A0A445BCT6_ARAHY|nr:hypothetical protein Ahy_A09g041447 isoform B [Arachis hypogaea]